MSYDLYFLDRKLGQTWEEAMEALEDPPSDGDARQAAPPDWAHAVARARGVLGEVSTFENPPNWELTHEETGIQLGSFKGQWSITVPYWSAVSSSRLKPSGILSCTWAAAASWPSGTAIPSP